MNGVKKMRLARNKLDISNLGKQISISLDYSIFRIEPIKYSIVFRLRLILIIVAFNRRQNNSSGDNNIELVVQRRRTDSKYRIVDVLLLLLLLIQQIHFISVQIEPHTVHICPIIRVIRLLSSCNLIVIVSRGVENGRRGRLDHVARELVEYDGAVDVRVAAHRADVLDLALGGDLIERGLSELSPHSVVPLPLFVADDLEEFDR